MPLSQMSGVAAFGERSRWPSGAGAATCVAAGGVAVAWACWSGHTGVLGAGVVGVIIFFACWSRPRVALTLWLLSMTMIPVWVSIHFFATLPVYCVVALLAVAANIGRAPVRLTLFDVYFMLLVGLALIAVLFENSGAPLWAQIVVRWGIPFLAARVLVSATGVQSATNSIALIFGIVACLSLIEFIFAWHPFVELVSDSSEFVSWHGIQTRGGNDRSEWAFGHSIALGGSLALSIPFIARSTYRQSARLGLLGLVFAAIVVTASRGALFAAALTVLICFFYVARARIVRTASILLVAFSGVLLLVTDYLPLLANWARGGSDEERASFNYRDSLYSTYLSSVEWLGKAPVYVRGTDGSIDSAFLRIGLEFGWVVLLVVLIPLLVASLRVVSGRASAAEIAIVGQIPLFATVALITQYESLVFVAAGIAVQSALEVGSRSRSRMSRCVGDKSSPGHSANDRRSELPLRKLPFVASSS